MNESCRSPQNVFKSPRYAGGVLAGILLFLGAAQAQHAHHHAHKHGHAKLEVSLEQGRLSLELVSPMDNLVGFEHAPKNDRQTKALAELQGLLENPANFFEPNKEALCSKEKVLFRSHLFGDAHGDAPKADKVHADLRYQVSFNCKAADALKEVNVTAFKAFRRLHEIETQLVTDRPGSQARAFELGKRNTLIRF
jgi:hypothetical protein